MFKATPACPAVTFCERLLDTVSLSINKMRFTLFINNTPTHIETQHVVDQTPEFWGGGTHHIHEQKTWLELHLFFSLEIWGVVFASFSDRPKKDLLLVSYMPFYRNF